MAHKGALPAAAVVVVFNLATIALVTVNRSGEPEAVLELTERELSLPPREAENTALALRLEWVDPEAMRPGPGWFDRRKLQEIGFDCRLAPSEETRQRYMAAMPRATYAVLEYEGDAWQRYLAEPSFAPEDRRAPYWVRRAEADPALRPNGSHLVLIDVGNDASALRARYPDRRRQVVMPAVAAVRFVEERGQAPYLEGRVTAVMPQQLNVERSQRRLLETFQSERRGRTGAGPAEAATPAEPKYRATVKWGRSLEPWLTDVQPGGR